MFNIGAGYDPAVGILDTLGTYGVPASMFVMGWLAEQNPWLVQQIAAWGHPVGSHGYVPPELTSRSDDDVTWDLQTASGALSSALGYDPDPGLRRMPARAMIASDRSLVRWVSLRSAGAQVLVIGTRALLQTPSTATPSMVHSTEPSSRCISMRSEVSTERPLPCRGSSMT